MNRPNSRLRGLAATLALVAFVVGVPVVLVAIDAVPDLERVRVVPADGSGRRHARARRSSPRSAGSPGRSSPASSSPRSSRRFAASVRRACPDSLCRSSPPIGSSPPRRCCSSQCPAVSAVLPQPRAHAAVAAPLPERPGVSGRDVEPPVPHPSEDRVQAAAEPETERYTVKRGDSLWKIAEDRLGDGTRYVELVALNEAVLDGRPDFLLPGTVLKVPIADDCVRRTSYVVQPGDTLSEIAEDELGDADAYPSIFEASRDTVQPNGAHLTDPDLILPGWKLTIPGQPSRPSRRSRSTLRTHLATRRLLPTDGATPPAPEVADPAPEQADPESAEDETAPSWLLPGLAGAGALLAGSLWLVLRQHRRTQLRYRRPGTIIAPPPDELRAVEKSVQVTGSATAHPIEELDAALRGLDPAPRLVTVELSASRIVLTLAEPAELPTPWTGEGAAWQSSSVDAGARLHRRMRCRRTRCWSASDRPTTEHSSCSTSRSSARSRSPATAIEAPRWLATSWLNWSSTRGPRRCTSTRSASARELAAINRDFVHIHDPGRRRVHRRLGRRPRVRQPDRRAGRVPRGDHRGRRQRSGPDALGRSHHRIPGTLRRRSRDRWKSKPSPPYVDINLSSDGRLTDPVPRPRSRCIGAHRCRGGGVRRADRPHPEAEVVPIPRPADDATPCRTALVRSWTS